MTPYVIETTSLSKHYGSRQALSDLTLKVPHYSVMGLIGPNGAGKTTWMMAVAGLLQPSGGHINLLGAGSFDPDIHSGRVTLLPQDSELPLDSKPLDLLTYYGRLQGLKIRQAHRMAREALERVNLGDRLNATVRSLSHGMRKRVMIAQCFIGYPEVVLLDEPLSGLDPHESAAMRNFLKSRRGHQTIVISSHNLHELEELCDHLAFIEGGCTLKQTTLEEVTGRSGTLIYHLEAPPADLALLERLLPEAKLAFDARQCHLRCDFDAGSQNAATINARLLPALLRQCGLSAIAQGSSLEHAYLDMR